jgi:hypothetical protein
MSLYQEKERIQHDPRTKQQIKDALYNALYAPVKVRMHDRLGRIIVNNTLIIRSSHKSFSYKGTIYSHDSSPLPRKANRLHLSLHREMDEYLKELRNLNEKEVPYVVGYLNQVLNSSNHLCDYYRLLPDALHPVLKKIIETCPCTGNDLPEEKVKMIQETNQQSLTLMKERLVINLII